MTGFESPNYTQTPNDLFDDMLPTMGDSELKVTLCAIRHTFGYHRDRFRLSLTVMMKETGLSRQGVINGAEAAEKRGTLSRIQDGGVTIWLVNVVDQLKEKPDMGGNSIDQPVNKIDHTGKDSRPPSIKENSNKSIKENISHPDFDAACSILKASSPADYAQAAPVLLSADEHPNRLHIRLEAMPADFIERLSAALREANPRRHYQLSFQTPGTGRAVAPEVEDDPPATEPVSAADLELWQNILGELRVDIHPATYRAYIAPARPIAVNGDWTIAVPSVTWWRMHMPSALKRIYKGLTGHETTFVFQEAK